MTKTKNIKKVSAAVLTGILAASLTVSAFAAPGPGGNGGRGGQGMMPPAQNSQNSEQPEFGDGERPELPEFEDGERPELPEFEDGERPELPELKDGERPELPEFEDGEQPELPEGADSCERPDGNMDQSRGGKGGRPGQGGGMGLRGAMMDPEAIAEAISEVEDEETQTTLSDLLSAYQEALDAEKEALDNAAGKEEDIDIESLRNAVKEARDELTSALEEAGVEIELPERLEAPNGERSELTDEERENLPELSDGQRRAGKGDNAQITDGQENGTGSAQGSTEGKQGKTGFFSKIKNAVSNFFGGFKK